MMRTCEGCGARMSPFIPRQRRATDNKLVCAGCAGQNPQPFGIESMLMSREAAGERAAYDRGYQDAIAGRDPQPMGAASAHYMDGYRKGKRQGEQRAAARKVAHDSGDGETIYHCPFCGAGQVTGRSDGTAECGFCNTSFTVQVQPSMSAVPQTIDGTPHVHPDMPGSDPGSAPEEGVDEQVEEQESETVVNEEEKEENPLFTSASRFYLTAEGVALPEDAYLRHLAIQYADDRDSVIADIRRSRR